MKAIRITDGKPVLEELPRPEGEDVLVKVAAASICGSDLHLIASGMVEGRILGHEFCGTTPDGTAVAIEPIISCGHCAECLLGERPHCLESVSMLGVWVDGGMAEYVRVPERTLVPLPSGLELSLGSLVEPIAVAEHSLNRARITPSDRVLVIGAGPIGLAVVACLAGRDIACDIVARHPHQQNAADRLGARLAPALADAAEDGGRALDGPGYDVVFDAAGTTASLRESVRRLRPRGRIGMVSTPWEPISLGVDLTMKEAEILPASMYVGLSPNREFEAAARLLADSPLIADAIVTHRFPLEAAGEAFETAADRAAGAIKVIFDV